LGESSLTRLTRVTTPALKDVKGAFNMQSTSPDIDAQCAEYQKMAGSTKVIKGKIVCKGNVSKPGGQGTSPTTAAGGSSSGKPNSASGLQVSKGSALAMSAALVALLSLF